VAAWLVWQTWTATPAASAPLDAVGTTGTVDIQSAPEGSSVSIDGTVRGITPLRLALPAGAHTVTITNGSTSRTLPVTVTPGGVASQYVEVAAQAQRTGQLEIASEPAGAQVEVDGVSRGRTPVVFRDMEPGQYRIRVSTLDTSVDRTVTVASGTASALVVATAPAATNATAAAAAAGGWLTVQAPVELDILENGRMLGNTKMDRVMVPAGSHRIELANAGLEFNAARTVQISAGKTSEIVIGLPSGRLSVNAIPWADVSLDGVALGTTPLGDLTAPIGVHELIFRHPQLGERRQLVTVKAQTVARIGIDLRK
jgi:serine/threonine-protein kinase